MFRRLGLVPGPEVDREATAILLDRDHGDLVPELDELVSAHLVFEYSPGRYRMHDLLSRYARQHAAREPATVREQTLHRLLSWYLLTTHAAVRIMFSAPPFEAAELELTGGARDFSGPADAGAWLDAELVNLAMAVTRAAEHGPAPFAWHLTHGLNGYLYIRASGAQQMALARTALRAAVADNDVKGQGMCHEALAMAAVTVGDLQGGLTESEAALDCYTRIQYTSGIRYVVGDLGDGWLRVGDIRRAVHYFEEFLQLQPPMSRMSYVALTDLAQTHLIRGNHAEALRLNSECLAYAQQTGAIRLISVARLGLAMADLDLGDPVTAEPLFLEANVAAVELGTDVDAFDVLAGLVLCCARTGRISEAFTWMAPLRDLIARGVTSYTGDDWVHAAILEAHLAADRLDEAIAIGEPALAEYDHAGHRLTAMRVRIRLGRIHAALGNTETARRHWETALPYTIEQSLPDRNVIEKLLTDLPPPT